MASSAEAPPPTFDSSLGGDAAPGWWSPRTASVDWCEPNYVHTPYVAEFYNTLSSLAVVVAGAAGLALSWSHSYRRRFALSFMLMLIVGVGSVAFHGTLRKEGQALDELPMVFGTQAFTFIAVEASVGGFGRVPRLRWLAPLLTLSCVAFAAGYVFLGSAAFLFFVALYISGVLLLVGLSCGLYRRLGAGARRIGIASNILYGGGFLLLWLPDVFHCALVQRFSFHAWFHLTSTLGPWCGLCFLTFAHYQLAHEAQAAERLGGAKAAAAASAEGAALPAEAAPRPELHYAAGCLPYVVLVREREAAAPAASPRASGAGAGAVAVETLAAAAGGGAGATIKPKPKKAAQD